MPDINHIISAPIEVIEFASTPAAPPAGTLLVYPKTDDRYYQQTSGGVETIIGGAESMRERIRRMTLVP